MREKEAPSAGAPERHMSDTAGSGIRTLVLAATCGFCARALEYFFVFYVEGESAKAFDFCWLARVIVLWRLMRIGVEDVLVVLAWWRSCCFGCLFAWSRSAAFGLFRSGSRPMIVSR